MRRRIIGGVIVVVVLGLGVLAAIEPAPVSLREALARQASWDAATTKFQQIGIYSCHEHTRSSCDEMLVRAEKNPALKRALVNAHEMGVYIWVAWIPWPSPGDVETGAVTINTFATDEKIIAFLTE